MSTFAEYGAIVVLTRPTDDLAIMRAAFTKRRLAILDMIRNIDGLSCVKPKGAFYILVDISKVGLDSVTFCQKLLDEKHVATIPGVAFGAEGTLRISYATDLDTIERGLERLSGFVKAYT